MDKMNTPKGKFNNFEEAFESVQGTKIVLVQKYSKFLESSYTYDDLLAEADMAIWEAWLEWEPEKSKFNTFAYNKIFWHISNFLSAMSNRFKVNNKTYSDVIQSGETLESVKALGKTKSEKFNEEFGLDGSEEAKKKVTRSLFQQYIYFCANNSTSVKMINASNFKGEEDDFDIFDAVTDDVDIISQIEEEREIEKLTGFKKQVAEMLVKGDTIEEIAAQFKMGKKELFRIIEGRLTKREQRLANAEKARAIRDRVKRNQEVYSEA